MLKFYGYKKCGTCRKAEKYLEAQGIAYEFKDITIEPPTDQELEQVVEWAGLGAKKAFNTSGVQYKSENWKDKIKGLSDEEMIEQLKGKGRLMKRPMILSEGKATIGFKEETFAEVWK